MRNPFRKSKSTQGPKMTQSMVELASAMSKLAENLEKFQDPVLWQKRISDAIQAIPSLAPLYAPRTALPAAAIEAVTVRLSDEERSKLAGQIYKAVKPQLKEFNKFVQQSLQDMPPHRLKELAEKIEQGEKPAIKRRHGCIFIAAGDTEIYLGL